MANHGYGHLSKKLSIEQLDSELQEINKSRFNSLFDITYAKDGDVTIWEVRRLNDKKTKYFYGFQIWLRKSGRIIEWRHTSSDFAWWVQETFANIITAKYNGMVSDDGCGPEKWKPNFHIQYPHLKDWIVRPPPAGFVWRMATKIIQKGYYRSVFKSLSKEVQKIV